jgi:hypothetical protein
LNEFFDQISMFKKYHGSIYFFGLVLLAISLPLSPFLLSLSQFILLGNWILELNYAEKWKILKARRSIWAFVFIFFMHLLGMIYSDDYTYGFHDLKIKLPLIILPLIVGTSPALPYKKFTTVLLFFCGAVAVSTIASTGRLFSWWGNPVSDVRDISFIISHIRLALMVNMAIFILVWFAARNSFRISISIGVACMWLIVFLFMLKSLTGIVIFLLLAIALLIWKVVQGKNLMLKWFLSVGIVMIVLMVAGYFSNAIARFYYVEKTDVSSLERTSVNGNLYVHDTLSKDFENGHYIWLYVCEAELAKEWNKRSSLDYKGTDLKGQELRFTLIRYLTSKGLRKDSVGMSTLLETDIKNIERGMANHIYEQKFNLYPRIYQLLWEINQYRQGGNPSGHSFTQRFEYMKAAVGIIHDNFWLGVGTGDVAKAFESEYNKQNSQLTQRWRLRAHNQFVTFFLTFGLVGFLPIVFAFLYPVFAERKWRNYFIILFLSIAFLSFLNEDTLETQAGISFFVLFFVFFLYNANFKNEVEQYRPD